MSLSLLKRKYGKGTRQQVINRVIMAEYPEGSPLILRIRDLQNRLFRMGADNPQRPGLESELAGLAAQRATLTAEVEQRHGVGPNLNRSPKRVRGAVLS